MYSEESTYFFLNLNLMITQSNNTGPQRGKLPMVTQKGRI